MHVHPGTTATDVQRNKRKFIENSSIRPFQLNLIYSGLLHFEKQSGMLKQPLKDKSPILTQQKHYKKMIDNIDDPVLDPDPILPDTQPAMTVSHKRHGEDFALIS